MRKETQHLRGGLAAAAVCSILIFGCSTNHTPGDGQPSTSPPMTPAATPGSSSGTTNPPMASAMDLSNQVQRSVDAQAFAAAHQRERFLGYINPAGPQPTPPDQMPVTGQLIPPSQYANPEVTVNSSISSGPNPVITSGANGDGGVTFVAAPATVSAATPGTTSASVATPTTAALTATPGQFAAGASTTATTASTTTVANTASLTPTLTSSITASPTRAANPPLASVGVTAASTSQTSSATTTAAPASTGRLVIANGATISNGTVRAVTNATGAITVTNVPVVIKGK
jgi:hypothetical protein